MRNILIDLNIIMDFFFNRSGHEKAAEVFGLCAEGELKGHVCAHEITFAHGNQFLFESRHRYQFLETRQLLTCKNMPTYGEIYKTSDQHG